MRLVKNGSVYSAPIMMIVLIKHSVYAAEIYPSFWGLWVILCILLLEYKSKEVADKMAYVSFIMLSFISIAGSDCGIMKLMPYCAAVTPICLCWNRKVGGAKYVCQLYDDYFASCIDSH